MYKRDVINFLFLISFAVYGVGNYVTAAMSPSIGLLLSSSTYLAIIGFYLLDMIYKKSFEMKLRTGVYWLMVLFLLSAIAASFISQFKGFPNMSMNVTVGKAIALFVPFHAFLVVIWYNRYRGDEILVRLCIGGLSLLLLVNLLGYGAGMTNQGHSLAGRLNLPFFGGLYSASSMMIFLSLVLIRQVGMRLTRPTQWSWRLAFIAINFVMIYLINSRLAIMIFFMILIMMFFGAVRSRAVYWVSLFTIPIVLSLRFFLYEIVSLPFFAGIMQRVDFQDVTSFNGRAYLWEIGMNWLLTDQRGILFGNGTGGQYFLDLLTFYARLWSGGQSDLLHFHSSSLEMLVAQGLFGYVIYAILLYKVFAYFREKYLKDEPFGDFLPAFEFMLFLLQVDTFVYVTGFGFMLFAFLLARVCVKEPVKHSTPAPEALVAEQDATLV